MVGCMPNRSSESLSCSSEIYIFCVLRTSFRFSNGKMLKSAELNEINRKKLSRNGQFLELLNLLPRDNGKYTCYVSNGDATINRTYSVEATRMYGLLYQL